MRWPEAEDHNRRIRCLFARIARRYDFLNWLMTFGQDQAWRREAVRRMRLRPGARLLDIGAGTGDLSAEALHQVESAHVVAADFTPEMTAVGRGRLRGRPVEWVLAEASALPFAGEVFEGVVSGFLVRNVPDPESVFREQQRVLRPSGRVACLDTSIPCGGPVEAVLRFHRCRLIPLLGWVLAGDEPAYTYLVESMESFLTPEDLAERMEAAGFRHVGFALRMLGSVAIHWGEKDPNRSRPSDLR